MLVKKLKSRLRKTKKSRLRKTKRVRRHRTRKIMRGGMTDAEEDAFITEIEDQDNAFQLIIKKVDEEYDYDPVSQTEERMQNFSKGVLVNKLEKKLIAAQAKHKAPELINPISLPRTTTSRSNVANLVALFNKPK